MTIYKRFASKLLNRPWSSHRFSYPQSQGSCIPKVTQGWFGIIWLFVSSCTTIARKKWNWCGKEWTMLLLCHGCLAWGKQRGEGNWNGRSQVSHHHCQDARLASLCLSKCDSSQHCFEMFTMWCSVVVVVWSGGMEGENRQRQASMIWSSTRKGSEWEW